MSLYTLTVDLVAKTGSFEKGMDNAERVAAQNAGQIQRTVSAMGNAVGTALVPVACPAASPLKVLALGRPTPLSVARRRHN